MKKEDVFNFKIEEPFLLRQMVIFPLTNGGANFDKVKPLRSVDLVKVVETERMETALIENRSPYDIFILDGEEIYGGLQNRVIDTTALIGSKHDVELPVSCVEKDRWEGKEIDFSPGYISFPSIRAVIADSVYNSLLDSGLFRANQNKIWETVSKKLSSLKIQSLTSSMHDIFSSFEQELDLIIDNIETPDNFNGFIVGINGKVKWMDFFGDKKLLKHYFNPLMKSYLIESMDKKGGKFISGNTVKKFIDLLKNVPIKVYDGVDKGEELRFRVQEKGIKGKVLFIKGKPLHISVFC